MRRLGIALLAVACLPAASALAQGIPRTVARYQPPTPTTSRYLTVFQGAGGAVSNYYGLVRPQERQLAQINQQQREQRSLLEARVAELEDAEVRSTGQRSWYTLRSQRNTFRDTSHYFMRWDDRRLPNAQGRR